MIRLKPDQFNKAVPLFAEMAGWNVYVTAVLHQSTPGRVYVDNLEAPRSGFAVSLDCAYLVGDPDNTAFNQALKRELAETLLAGDQSCAGRLPGLTGVGTHTGRHFGGLALAAHLGQ